MRKSLKQQVVPNALAVSKSRDWRRPSVPIQVEDGDFATSEVGRDTLDYKARFSQQEIGRRLEGYVCIQCWEPHETPFPERCSLCSFPMRARQLSTFHEQFEGDERARWVERIEKELDQLEDTHERNFHETSSGIVIPRALR